MNASRRSSSSTPAWASPIYLDASALVKLFVPEAESDALNEALIDAEDVILSDLALTEMASALGRRTREGSLTPLVAHRLYREAEKLAASCRRVELTPPIHRHAERLLLLSLDNPLRALDALHVATALDAEAATLVTYDPRLREAARSQGLFVAPDSASP
jgi:predicted nucleic acid-binding protein